MTDVRYGHGLKPCWMLEPDAIYLNHGSFGATPRRVLAAQTGWRERLEQQPVRFMTRELPPALRVSAGQLGAFVGAKGDDLVFVDNATTGVNTVLRSITWSPGDELVISHHAYRAVRHAVVNLGRQFNVVVREAWTPFPLLNADAMIEAYRCVLGPRTRLVIVDHVSSPTAAIAPVQAIAAMCRAGNVPVLIDGAHAPGMLPLHIEAIGADWYTGNCHKWLFAPKGCAFLWTAESRQAITRPLVTSAAADADYRAAFDWTGTRDPSAWLALPTALAFYADLGADALAQRNHDLIVRAADILAQAWESEVGAPAACLGTMATVALPQHIDFAPMQAAELHDWLWDAQRIEVPVLTLENRLWVRISAQAYNAMEDYAALAQAVLAYGNAG